MINKLWLEINSEPFEMKCDGYLMAESGKARCDGKGRLRYPDGHDATLDCPRCKETPGTRSVKLCGKARNIVIQPVSGGYVPGLKAWIMFDGVMHCETHKYFCEPFQSDPYKSDPIYKVMEELHDNVVKAHHAGTLPKQFYKSDENPKGLEIVGVT